MRDDPAHAIVREGRSCFGSNRKLQELLKVQRCLPSKQRRRMSVCEGERKREREIEGKGERGRGRERRRERDTEGEKRRGGGVQLKFGDLEH